MDQQNDTGVMSCVETLNSLEGQVRNTNCESHWIFKYWVKKILKKNIVKAMKRQKF